MEGGRGNITASVHRQWIIYIKINTGRTACKSQVHTPSLLLMSISDVLGRMKTLLCSSPRVTEIENDSFLSSLLSSTVDTRTEVDIWLRLIIWLVDTDM